MFYVTLTAILLFSGLVMGGLTVLFRSPASASHRIRPENGRRLDNKTLFLLVSGNGLLSIVLLYGVSYLAFERLFYQGSPSWPRLALEAVGVLLVYDFVYYLAHRFLLHGPIQFFYRIHVLHHTAKFPQAVDSLYVHPLETTIGLTLLLFSTWLLGPVHIGAFAAIFFVYSLLNIVIHGGLSWPIFPFRYFSFMANKHDTHHKSLKAGNYASITPLFDKLLGTAE